MLPNIPVVRDACERYISLEAMALRHSPALRGVCLYDEFYESGESATPQPLVGRSNPRSRYTLRASRTISIRWAGRCVLAAITPTRLKRSSTARGFVRATT